MRFDRPADDREPEAGAVARALREADERFEDPFALIRRDAGPVVGHRDGWAVRGLGGFDDDGVGDRRARSRAGFGWRGGARRDRRWRGRDRWCAARRVWLASVVAGGGDRGICEVGEVDGFAVWSLARVEAREVEEVVDQVPEPAAVARELGFDAVPSGPERLLSQQSLGGRLDRGDRRAELVRGVGQERSHRRLRRSGLRDRAIEEHQDAGERGQERERDHAADRFGDLEAVDLSVDPGSAPRQCRVHVGAVDRDHLVHREELSARGGWKRAARRGDPGEVDRDPLRGERPDDRLEVLRCARLLERPRARREVGA